MKSTSVITDNCTITIKKNTERRRESGPEVRVEGTLSEDWWLLMEGPTPSRKVGSHCKEWSMSMDKTLEFLLRKPHVYSFD